MQIYVQKDGNADIRAESRKYRYMYRKTEIQIYVQKVGNADIRTGSRKY